MEIRRLRTSEVAPLIDTLKAEGLPSDLDDGIWIGAVDLGVVVGLGRVLEREGIHMLEDVWVVPGHREHGVASGVVAAAKARYRPLWLICDEDMTGYYTRRGFVARPPEDFPSPLASLYAAKGEWPGGEHVHVAMIWDPA